MSDIRDDKSSGKSSLISDPSEREMGNAEENLCERRKFELNAVQWAAFMAALDAAPRDLPRLRRLFSESRPFDSPERG